MSEPRPTRLVRINNGFESRPCVTHGSVLVARSRIADLQPPGKLQFGRVLAQNNCLKKEPMDTIVITILMLAVIPGAVGYWRNLIGVMALGDAGPVDSLFALKLVGVFFPPLGAVMGWR